MEREALVDCLVVLERFPGKGGWTYAPLPPTALPGRNWFGMLKVAGRLDDYELPPSHLMPMGQGRMFLPVKADIRKRIGKQAGDTVHLLLYAEIAPLEISDEDFRECLAEEPRALQAYEQLSPAEQQAWLHWVCAAVSDEAKVARVTTAVAQLAAGRARQPQPERQGR
jgi:hypothetical protein